MIKLRVLGNPDLEAMQSSATEALLSQPKRTALLVYLALARPPGFHRRDKLLGLFWPEADTSRARSSLRSAVYFLRQNLGDDVLISRGDAELGIDPARLWCDATAFDDAVSANRVEEALALYRGPFLDGFFVADAPEFERWLEDERARLHARAAEAAWRLAEQADLSRNVPEALKWARYAAAFSPGDEVVIRRLIEFIDRNGDRAAALRAYDDFALQLKRDYELEPSAETRSLVEAIRSRAEPISTATPLSVEPIARQQSLATANSQSRVRVGRNIAAAILMVLSIAAAMTFRSGRLANGKADAFTLIVLPFRTVGPDAEAWREGMVDALSTNLDGAGGLRVIDPRTALSGWSADTEAATAPMADALGFAARKDASLMLTGSVLRWLASAGG